MWLYVVLNIPSTHKSKHDRWLARHSLVHCHYTPTHASWLNQVEVCFSTPTQAVLRSLSATDSRQVHQAIDRFTAARNEHPVPFEWTVGSTLEKQKLLRGCAPRNDF